MSIPDPGPAARADTELDNGTLALPALFAPLDLCILIALVVLTPLAWLLPERLWPRLGRGVAVLAMRCTPRTLARHAERIEKIFGPSGSRQPAGEIYLRGLSHFFEDTLLVLKCYRPGWKPRVQLQGVEHLRAAAAENRGAVLWLGHFMYSSIATKMALRQAGVDVIHLSHPRHGFSGTRFGMRFLNPIRLRVEDRYLRERVRTGVSGSGTAVYTLRARLLEGRFISITARDSARNTVRAPFLNGSLPLATGAPILARQAGAALLPVHTVKDAAGDFITCIDKPIALDDSLPRREAAASAAREYIRRLEPVVREYPDQWLGWSYLEQTDA
jgi:lauroyl/myristoyl acyltransferase